MESCTWLTHSNARGSLGPPCLTVRRFRVSSHSSRYREVLPRPGGANAAELAGGSGRHVVADDRVTRLVRGASRPPSHRLKALAGERKGQHSIRVNDQWRVCFCWTEHGAMEIEITGYH